MTEPELKQLLTAITPPSETARAAAHAHWASLAKPLGGLGALETLLEDAAALTGTAQLAFDRRAVLVLCADNGVVAQGVSQTDQSVTRAVAEAMGADKLIFLTDTDGILVDSHNQSTRIARMDVARAKELMDSGLIAGGMIPKTMNCIHAVEHGVGSVTVLDGRMEHAVLLEAIAEKSLGTTMEKKK